jgi:hypothetical protein
MHQHLPANMHASRAHMLNTISPHLASTITGSWALSSTLSTTTWHPYMQTECVCVYITPSTPMSGTCGHLAHYPPLSTLMWSYRPVHKETVHDSTENGPPCAHSAHSLTWALAPIQVQLRQSCSTQHVQWRPYRQSQYHKAWPQACTSADCADHLCHNMMLDAFIYFYANSFGSTALLICISYIYLCLTMPVRSWQSLTLSKSPSSATVRATLTVWMNSSHSD